MCQHFLSTICIHQLAFIPLFLSMVLILLWRQCDLARHILDGRCTCSLHKLLTNISERTALNTLFKWGSWWFRSSGMLHCVDWWIFWKCPLSSSCSSESSTFRTAWPWRGDTRTRQFLILYFPSYRLHLFLSRYISWQVGQLQTISHVSHTSRSTTDNILRKSDK
jgi:hypothetical protein